MNVICIIGDKICKMSSNERMKIYFHLLRVLQFENP